MKIKIVYFGLIVDALNLQSEWIEKDEISENLNDFFEKRHPKLKKINYKIAVDGDFSNLMPKNKTPKEIAIFPPFAGG